MSAHTVTDTDGWPRPSRPTPGTGRLCAGVEREEWDAREVMGRKQRLEGLFVTLVWDIV